MEAGGSCGGVVLYSLRGRQPSRGRYTLLSPGTAHGQPGPIITITIHTLHLLDPIDFLCNLSMP